MDPKKREPGREVSIDEAQVTGGGNQLPDEPDARPPDGIVTPDGGGLVDWSGVQARNRRACVPDFRM